MQEIWKDIQDYEGLYQVSNLGNVRTLSFRGSGLTRPMKASPTNCGYYKVQLHKNGKGKMLYVHRLVALAFIPNPYNKKQINHIDGNKANNHVSNLEWASASDNQLHSIAHGLRQPSPMTGRTGRKNPNSKPIYQCDLDGKVIARWDSISDACRFFGKGTSHISQCLTGKTKTAYGFKWEYE